MTVLVEIEDVFRVYPSPEGGVAALQGLSLAVERGGALRRARAKWVGQVDAAPDRRRLRPRLGRLGSRRRRRRRLAQRGAAARFRSRSIGYADQHYWRALAGELTARELVGIQLGLGRRAGEQRDARADELLERVGLGDRGDAHPRELSGGEQQRVALCAALASRPALLIADEPTGELDAATARDVLKLIAELVRESAARRSWSATTPPRPSGPIASSTSATAASRTSALPAPPATVRSWSAAAAGSGSRRTCSARPGSTATPRPSFAATRSSSQPAGASVSETQAQLVPHEQAVSGQPESASVSETQSPIVEALGLTKRFGAEAPFERLDAAFAPGKLTVVTGPSGSGKTTLLRLLSGLELPDEGDVLLDGVSLAGLDRAGRAELRRTRLAFVGQTAGLTPFLGARENVELALELRGLPTEESGPRWPRLGLPNTPTGPSPSSRPASVNEQRSRAQSPSSRR